MSIKLKSVQQLERNIYKSIKKRWEGWSSPNDPISKSDTVFINGKWVPVLPTRFTTWSGVREVGYKLGKDLSFEPLGIKTSNGANYPFDFILQTAITEAHEVANINGDRNKEFIDEDPWQYPLLKRVDRINSNVFLGRHFDQERLKMREVFTRMAKFTEAQRLFRLAFEGRLGYDFPLANFLTLFKSLSSPVPYVKTPEWNIGN